MSLPHAVLFDCDGVIVDSEGPSFALFVADLAERGFAVSIAEFERDYIGGTVEDVADKVRARGGELPGTWVAEIYGKLYDMLREGVPLIEGVTDVFDRLDAAGIPYAIGSNGTLEKMDITLGARGLLPRFRAVMSGQAIGKPKPLPDLYLACAAACGVAPADCVVIEDSAAGAKAALAAGMRCFGYAGHGSETPPARALRALGVPLFHKMEDLPALLGL